MLKSESCERKGTVDRVAQFPGDEIFYGTDIYIQDAYRSFFLHTNLVSVPCTKQKAPDNSDVKRSLHNCGAIVRNLLRVVCLASRIWRWLLSFCRICGPLAVLIRRATCADCWGKSWPAHN
jgi:hypothetical protein